MDTLVKGESVVEKDERELDEQQLEEVDGGMRAFRCVRIEKVKQGIPYGR